MSRYFHWLITLLLCFAFSLKGYAVAVLFDEESGLSNNWVNCIVQEKQGMMWIGTNNGLNRFDGYSFYEIPELKGARINCLFYDRENNKVWVGATTGLFYINCATQQIISCTGRLKKTPVLSILGIKKDVYVLFSRLDLVKITPDFRCRIIFRAQTEETIIPSEVATDGNQHIFIALKKKNGLLCINVREPQGTAHWSSFAYIASKQVGSGILMPSDKRLLRNLAGDSTSPGYIHNIQYPDQASRYVLRDKRNLYLVSWSRSTDLFKISLNGGNIHSISARNEPLLYAKTIYCLYEDDHHTVWAGTNRGLLKLPAESVRPPFEQLLVDPLTPISTRNITELENGDLCIATYSGLYTFTPQRKIINDRKIIAHALCNASRYLYIGSEEPYFFSRLNKETKKHEIGFYRYIDPGDKMDRPVLSIERDTTGTFWLATEGGLFFYNEQTETVSKYNGHVAVTNILSLTMRKDKRSFWIATRTGLYLMDINRNIVLHLDHKTTPALSSVTINIVREAPDGTIWIGTAKGGINILSPDFKNIRTVGKKEGLSSNEIYGILWQDKNEAWISTYKGLNYYNPVSGMITNYFKEDGLTQNEFNLHSSFQSSSGKLYFGGINGVTCFSPAKIPFTKNNFSLFLSSVSKYDKESDQFTDITRDIDRSIVMNPGDNQLTLSFGVSDFSRPERVTYYYMVDGVSKTWQSFNDRHHLRLESLLLSPGKYLLRIQGRRGQTEVSDNVLEYTLSITQVFYKTGWFYTLIGLMVVLAIYIYFWVRLNNMKKMELLRVKIASNLHDEVGSFLTQIAMFADRLSYKMVNDSETKDKLTTVAQLSRDANLAMSDVLWTIDARNDVVLSLTDRMREHAEDMLLQKGINIEFDFSEVENHQKSSPEFRQHFFWIFKESVNNIMKHSRATEVYIQFKQSGEHGRLLIRNNGLINLAGQANTGLGLKNIRMRANIIKGIAEIRTNKDEFIVEINF